MSIKLSELQRKRAAKYEEWKSHVEAMVAKDASEEGDEEKNAGLKGEVEDLDKRIKLIKEMIDGEAEEAEPVDEDDAEKSFAARSVAKHIVRSAPVEKGISAARWAMAQAIAKQNGSRSAGLRWAQQHYAGSDVAKALNTTTQVDGGALIPQDFSNDLIDLLRARSVLRSAGARVMPMPMGNLTIPRLQAASTAYWQDELSNMTASQQAFDNLYFSAKKLTANVYVTNDQMRRSPLSVEAIVRDDMVKQIGLAEDKAFFFGTGSANQPAGIVSLIAAANKFTDSTTAPTLATANSVLANLELLLTANNVDTSSATFFMHPSVKSWLGTLTDSVGRYFFREDLQQGKLLGYDVSTTTQWPTNIGTGPNFRSQIVFANVSDMLIADTLSIRVESSDVAGSTFTYDQTVFRCITEVDFNVAHDVSAAVAEVTNWRPTAYTANAGSANYTQTANTTGSASKSAKP